MWLLLRNPLHDECVCVRQHFVVKHCCLRAVEGAEHVCCDQSLGRRPPDACVRDVTSVHMHHVTHGAPMRRRGNCSDCSSAMVDLTPLWPLALPPCCTPQITPHHMTAYTSPCLEAELAQVAVQIVMQHKHLHAVSACSHSTRVWGITWAGLVMP